MGLISKIVILTACVAATLAQDYEYSINTDKVTVRQGPNSNSYQAQQPAFQPAFQPAIQQGSFLRPRPAAAVQRFETQNPQIRPQQPFAQEPQFESEQQYIPSQSKPSQFKQGAAASTYVPAQNNFRQAEAFTRAPIALNQIYKNAPTQFRQAEPFTRAPIALNQIYKNAPPQFRKAEPFTRAPIPAEPSYNEEQEFTVSKPAPVPQEPSFEQQPEQDSYVSSPAPVRRVSKTRINNVPLPVNIPSSSPRTQSQSAEDLAIIQEQNAAAKYSFSSDVQNGIQDNSLKREEVRDGLALKGMYSYSDGFYKRTVQYEADENGYRVVGESAEPIGNLEGPQLNLDGKAQVQTDIQGTGIGYSITADDIVDLRKLKNKQQSNFRIAV